MGFEPSVSLRLIRPTLGQLFVAGFVGDRLPVELQVLAREFQIGGLVFGPGNVTDALQAADLARDAQTLARDLPVWVAHRPAARLAVPPFTVGPPLMTLGRADDERLTLAFASQYAHRQLALGVTLEFLPELDLSGRAADVGVIGATLSPDAALAARHGALLVETLQAAGLAACAGHFPGIGEAQADAGLAFPLVDRPPDHLERVTWTPFRAAIDAGVSGMLVSHVVVPSLDATAPAPRSRRIVHDVLRQHLGFTGVVFAHDIDASSSSSDDGEDAAVQALRAGCDVIVQGSGNVDRLAATLEHIVKAAERDDLPVSRLEDALRRHEAMKAAFLSHAARRRRPTPPALAAVLATGDDARVAARMQEFV